MWKAKKGARGIMTWGWNWEMNLDDGWKKSRKKIRSVFKFSHVISRCQDAGLTLNYIFSWVDNTVQVCYLVWILLGFIFSIIIDGDFVRFFTMNMAYWISLDDYILTDLQEIFWYWASTKIKIDTDNNFHVNPSLLYQCTENNSKLFILDLFKCYSICTHFLLDSTLVYLVNGADWLGVLSVDCWTLAALRTSCHCRGCTWLFGRWQSLPAPGD